MVMTKRPEVLQCVFGIPAEEAELLPARWKMLTPRERQTVELIADGLKNRAVAEAMGISPKTQNIFRSNAVWKLGVPPVGFAKVVYYRRLATLLGLWPREEPKEDGMTPEKNGVH